MPPPVDPKHARFRLKLRVSKIHRWGVYAAEPIPSRHKVIEYTGERISRRETLRRGQAELTYLFTLDEAARPRGRVASSRGRSP